MDDLKLHVDAVLQAIPDPKERKRLRYGYGTLLRSLEASGKQLSSEILFSPNLTDLLETTLSLSRNAARTRASEIRKITSLLEAEGILSPPADLYAALGYPEDTSLCRTRSLWKRFQSEVIRNRIRPRDLTIDWLVSFIEHLRTEGKLTSRLRYEAFQIEWTGWRTAHSLPIPDLPDWEFRQDFYRLPWNALPEHLRGPLQTWLESSSRSGRQRKETTVGVYRNLLERYFGYRSTQGGAGLLSQSLTGLITAEEVHRFLCWRRDRTGAAGTETWTGTLLWEAGAFAQLLEHLGRREEAAQLRRWTTDQNIESSRVLPEGPSFTDLLQASEKQLRAVFALPEGHVRDLAIRDAVLFLDAILTGKSAPELSMRSVDQARCDWPSPLRGLLESYVESVRCRLLGRPSSPVLWIGAGGRPLTRASVRAILQKTLDSLFSSVVTPKRIQEAWLRQYLNDHPDDILTPASHLTRNPLSVHARKEQIEQRSAIRRIDETLSGGYAK